MLAAILRSSPAIRMLIVFCALACAIAAPSDPTPYVLYRANIHCHTGFSDAYWQFWPEARIPATAYAYAYANGMDAMAVTDHGEMLDPAEWQASIDAAKEASAGYWPFCAIHGFEWTGTTYVPDTGHLNVLGSRTRIGAYRTGQNTAADVFGTLDSFYGWVSQQAEAVDFERWARLPVVVQFNHPTAHDDSDHHNGYLMPQETRLRDSVCLFEMGSWVRHPTNPFALIFEGTVTYNDTFDPTTSPEYWYRIALQQGWRVAPSNSGDNHVGDYVWHHHLGPPTCTGIFMPQPPPWATALERQSVLLDALRARRTFSAEDRDADVLVTADAGAVPGSWWMGTAFGPPPGASVTMRVRASDPTDRIKEVRLFCPDGTVVREWTDLNTNAFDESFVLSDTELATLPVTNLGEICIYAKVTEYDGHLLFAAPFWISRPQHCAAIQPPNVFGSVGPVTFTTKLQRADNGEPLVEKNVVFWVDGVPVGTVRTNASGVASLNWRVPSVQSYVVMAQFDGDADAAACWAYASVDSAAFTSLTTLDRTGTVGEAVTLRGYLKRLSDNTWCVGKTVDFRIDGTYVGSGVTDADGRASYVWIIAPGPTERRITAEFAGVADLMSSRGQATLTAIVWATKMAAFDRTARITDRTELKCRLLRSDNTPLYNRPVNFYVDGTFVVTRPANVNGYASFPYYTVPDGDGAGLRTILSEWPGNEGYLAISKTSNLTVLKALPYIWVMPRTVPRGQTARLYAYFRRLYDYAKQEDKTVSWTIDGTWIGDSVTGTSASGEPGVARLNYDTSTLDPGGHTVRCAFGGDAWVDAGYGEGTLNVTP